MSALGQESEKVDRLVELLQERGFDPTKVLDEVWRRIPACVMSVLDSKVSLLYPVLEECRLWGAIYLSYGPQVISSCYPIL